jgi:hypothetical protein
LPARETYAALALIILSAAKAADRELLRQFQDAFAEWPEAWFEDLGLGIRTALKSFLRTHGIYMGQFRGRIAKQFHKLTVADEFPEWPPKKLAGVVFHPSSVLSEAGQGRAVEHQLSHDQQSLVVAVSAQRLQELRVTANDRALGDLPNISYGASPRANTAPVPTSNQPGVFTFPKAPMPATFAPPDPFPPFRPDQPQRTIETPRSAIMLPNPYEHSQAFALPRVPYPSVPPFQPIPEPRPHDSYHDLPPVPVSNKRLKSNKAALFIKIYDKNERYTGKPYDLFDDKLQTFFNICHNIKIILGQFSSVFPRILADKAQKYYLYYMNP